MDDITPAETLNSWLSSAFQERPDWIIRDRQPVGSYQQHMERVTLEWPDAGATEDVYVRVYHGYMSWWTITALDLPQRERAAQSAASAAGIPTPPILYAADSPDIMILGAMPGQSGRLPTTPAEAENIAETLATLHSAHVTPEEKRHLPDVSLNALLPLLAVWAAEAENDPLIREVEAMTERCQREIVERPATLIHGDWHRGNFMMNDAGRISAVIDWEEAAWGDPRIDIGNMYAVLLYRKLDELAAVFASTYEARTGFPLGPLRVWRDVTDLRNRVMSAWVKRAIAEGRALPSRNPEVWIED